MRKTNKLFCILGIYCLAILLMACQGKERNSQSLNQEGMQNLDSLLASYTATPVYYADYGNKACLFELRINDILVDELTSPGSIGLTSATINPYILKSDKQKVSVKLFPNPGSQMIVTDLYPDFEAFKLKINYVDFRLPEEQQEEIDVFKMPELRINPDEGGIPYFEFEGEFEAEVPYEITGWSDCIDLREIPDIEERVVKEFKRVRQLMVDHKFDELEQYFALKNNEASIVLYESSTDCEERWQEYIHNIKEGSEEDFQLIEDYRLVFSADGRSVTLKSTKKKGFPSALLWIKQEKNDPNWNAYCFELHIGIKKGTDKFIPILV